MNETLRFIDPNILASITSMELRARAVVEGFLSGLHKSPFKGFSVEFAEYRLYTPGDDPRHIDWKVYARTDRFYVKEFEEETNLACHLLLDLSRSMTYSSGGLRKLDYAGYLAASLAYLMARQRDAVGLFTFGDEIVDYVPAKVRTGHLHTVLNTLSAIQPVQRTDLGKPLHTLAEALQKKGMLILISDLLDDPEKIIESLEHFRFLGHDVLVFHVLDPAELTFPFHSTTRFVGLEDEGSLMAVPENVRAAYLERLKAHISRLRSGCGVNHIDYTVLDTSKPLDFALQAWLATRAGKM